MVKTTAAIGLACALLAGLLTVSWIVPSHAALEFVTDVQLPNCWASGVAIKDHYLLTTGSEETKSLWILDVADPSRPKVVSTWGPHYGYTQQVAVQGNYAYVSEGSSLLVFDISDMTQPRLVTSLPAVPPDWPPGRPAAWIKQAVVRGDYAYLATGQHGLAIADISDPADPTVVGLADVVGSTSFLAVAGDYAYLAARSAGLQIVSVADPAHPRRVGEYRPIPAPASKSEGMPGTTVGIAATGPIALTLSYGWYIPVMLTALDVSEPARPAVLGKLALQGNTTAGYGQNNIAQVSGGYAFVIAQDTLTTVDVSNPSAMSVVSVFSLPKTATVIHAEGVRGGWVPRTVDLLAPHPWGFGSFYYDEGTHVGYLIDLRWGLWVLDMSDMTHPRLVGAVPTAGEARVVQVVKDRAYLTDFNGGLFIFSLADPAHPNLLAQYYGICMHGFSADDTGRVYVAVGAPVSPATAESQGQIVILDTGDPARVRRAGTIVPPVFGAVDAFDGSGVELCWFEGLLYVTHRGELFVYGMRADGPALLGHAAVVEELREWGYECPPTPLFVARSGGRVLCYVASNQVGLSVVDVTDPANMTVVACLNQATSGVSMLDVESGYAYVVRSGNSVWVVDVSDPAAPRVVSDFSSGVYARAVGDRAWVAEYSSGVYEWDISDRAHPTLVGGPYRHTSGNNFSLDVSGDYLYRADVGALEVYRIIR